MARGSDMVTALLGRGRGGRRGPALKNPLIIFRSVRLSEELGFIDQRETTHLYRREILRPRAIGGVVAVIVLDVLARAGRNRIAQDQQTSRGKHAHKTIQRGKPRHVVINAGKYS